MSLVLTSQRMIAVLFFFFFQAEDGIRDLTVTGVQTVLFRSERGDVAAVILEPAGGQAGTTPTIPGYLQELRALTTRHGVVLIFDEVITGFRYAPGGAQAYFGVTPDLTTLAKIVAGGLPGGAPARGGALMWVRAVPACSQRG